MSLQGKTAIVTGASSGMGQAFAKALAAEGVNVVVNGQRGQRLDEFTKEHDNARALAGDITDPRVVDRLFDLAQEAFGGVDIVVNNAGYMTSGPIEQIDLDLVSRMVRINVDAAFRIMYKAIKHFKARGSGHLVNMSSIVGMKVAAEVGAYAGTKHAIEALAHALRLEVARTDIRITNLQPGLVATELHRDYAVSMAKQRNINKPLSTEDIARALLFALKQPDHVRIAAILIVPGESPI
jgi:NADP-dependent 3-hydroxy acid dehydrogenase YdfG